MYLSIPQIIQELLRIKNQLIPGYRGHNDRFGVDFLVFFDDCNGHFSEFVRAQMTIIEKQGIFRGEEIEHVFRGLVVRDAVAAELKMSKGYDFVWIVSDGVFEDDFEAEFSFLFYSMKFKKIEQVFFSVRQSVFRQMFIAHKRSFYTLPHPIHT
jgi:hypothetical protein